MQLDPRRTAVVAIDMHRGHLDPAVATLPLPAERCPGVIARAKALFAALRVDRRADRACDHRLSRHRRADGQPVLEGDRRRPEQEAQRQQAAQRGRHAGHRDHPDLLDPRDSCHRQQEALQPVPAHRSRFPAARRLKADTVILAGVNTTSCVFCASFEATNRDYRVVIAADACDSMDGEEAHRVRARTDGQHDRLGDDERADRGEAFGAEAIRRGS